MVVSDTIVLDELDGCKAATIAIEWNPSGNKVVYSKDDSTIRLAACEGFAPHIPKASQDNHRRPVSSIAWVDDDTFVTVARDSDVYVWSAESLDPVFKLPGANGKGSVNHVVAATNSGDEDDTVINVAVGATNNAVTVYKLDRNVLKPLTTFKTNSRLFDLSFNKPGDKLLCTVNGGVEIWSLGGTLEAVLPLSSTGVTSITYSTDGSKFVVGTNASEVQVVETANLTTSKSYECHVDEPISTVDFHSGPTHSFAQSYVGITYESSAPAAVYRLSQSPSEEPFLTIPDCQSGKYFAVLRFCPRDPTTIAYTDKDGACKMRVKASVRHQAERAERDPRKRTDRDMEREGSNATSASASNNNNNRQRDRARARDREREREGRSSRDRYSGRRSGGGDRKRHRRD